MRILQTLALNFSASLLSICTNIFHSTAKKAFGWWVLGDNIQWDVFIDIWWTVFFFLTPRFTGYAVRPVQLSRPCTKLGWVNFSSHFIQKELIQTLSEWQTKNAQLTKELCNKLLSELRRKHLHPLLQQLQGYRDTNFCLQDIKRAYHCIKTNYYRKAYGEKEVIAEAFLKFQTVSSFLFNSYWKWRQR